MPLATITPFIEQIRGAQPIAVRTRTRARIAALLAEHWISPRLEAYPLADTARASITDTVAFLAAGYLAHGTVILHDAPDTETRLPDDTRGAIQVALSAAWQNCDPCVGTTLPRFWDTLLVRPRGVS